VLAMLTCLIRPPAIDRELHGASYRVVWIISPAIDLLFVCGGAMLLLALGQQHALQHMHRHELACLGNIALLAALLIGETHTIATIFAVWVDTNCRRRHGRFSCAAAAISLSLMFLIGAFAALAPYMVRIYLLAVSWHFVMQARGILLMYCRLAHYERSRFQAAIWDWLLDLTMINWMLVQLSDYFCSGTETFLLQRLAPIAIVPRLFVDMLLVTSALLAVIAVLNLGFRILCGLRLPPLPAMLLLFVVAAIFSPGRPFVLMQQSIWLYAPALFHGSQYLCVMARRLKDSTNEQDCSTLLPLCYLKCLTLSLSLFIALPWLLTLFFAGHGLTFGAALAAIFIGLQLYHLALDAVIWRRPPLVLTG